MTTHSQLFKLQLQTKKVESNLDKIATELNVNITHGLKGLTGKG
jgi:hypothetical protein